jgi:hypothetical protein
MLDFVKTYKSLKSTLPYLHLPTNIPDQLVKLHSYTYADDWVKVEAHK